MSTPKFTFDEAIGIIDQQMKLRGLYGHVLKSREKGELTQATVTFSLREKHAVLLAELLLLLPADEGDLTSSSG